MKEKMRRFFTHLEERIRIHNQDAFERGGISLGTPIEIQVVGQMALLLSDLNIPIASTVDLDALYPDDFAMTKMLEDELLKEGLILDPDKNLIWMPQETTYRQFFEGTRLHVSVAEPLFVIASKCKFKRVKDRNLLVNFFNAYPDAREKINQMGISSDWIEP